MVFGLLNKKKNNKTTNSACVLLESVRESTAIDLSSAELLLNSVRLSADIVNNTVDPIEFILNLKKTINELHELSEYEDRVSFKGRLPSENLKTITQNINKTHKLFIDRCYDSIQSDLISCGGDDEAEKAKSKFYLIGSFTDEMSKDNKDYYEHKIAQLFDCNVEQRRVSTHYDLLGGHEFERFCAEILRNNGFTNVEVTSGSGDYGVDILALKDGISYAIQCKCYSSNIGNKSVQEAYSGRDYYRKNVGVVLTNQYFTPAAKETAERTGIALWDRDKLNQMIEIANFSEGHRLETSYKASSGTSHHSHDELLPDAVELILETGHASVSTLQRRLKLGYSRAARIIDEMEELGIVGAFEGSKPRALLINRQQWQKMQNSLNDI